MATINMHMKFEIEILKQTWLTSRKPCHLQSPEIEKSNMANSKANLTFAPETMSSTDRRTDGRTDNVNPAVYPLQLRWAGV